MNYEAWRISYQDSEKAARAAWNKCQRLKEEIERLSKEVLYLRQYGNKDCIAMADAAMQRNELL